MADSSDVSAFPRGHLFLPLLADPKQPQFRLSTWWVDTSAPLDVGGFAVFGETFGLMRLQNEPSNSAFQIEVAGGVFAQFDLASPSSDLINADYTGGLPITYRKENFSARFRVYHQSSHLGDEFLINQNPARINLSYEAIEILGAYDVGGFRFYGGGEYFVRTDPDDVDPGVIHLGVEYRHGTPFARFTENTAGRWVGGVDLRMWQEDDFIPAVSFKGGMEIGPESNPEEKERYLRVLFEFYRGISPHGQFFLQDVHVLGVGMGLQIGL
ncbi:MAG TPA: DUF1207 domain-containing protein [Bdellovibrionota bacterium]|nr:DUF1207 domain-containing protein [Bdellovibrionota bacterium]